MLFPTHPSLCTFGPTCFKCESHMLQVDFFLSYALGSSMALTSLPALSQPASGRSGPKVGMWAALILALVWAPSGLILLWMHPAWETMQVVQRFDQVPTWLVLAFVVTNFTQGMLGHVLTQRMLARGNKRLAVFNARVGFFVTFFLLTFGWDGRGFDRFLFVPSSDAVLQVWVPGAGATLQTLPAALWGFMASPVAMLLLITGAGLVGGMGVHMASGFRQLWLAGQHRAVGGFALHRRVAEGLASYLTGILGVSFFAALVCALCSGAALGMVFDQGAHGEGQALLAAALGLPAGLLMVWPVLLKRGALSAWLLKPLFAARQHAMGAV